MHITKHHLTRKMLEALRLRTELAKSGVTRRQLFKFGVAGGATLLASTVRLPGMAFGSDLPPSPPTTPWLAPLPIPPVLQTIEPSLLNLSPNEPHQYYTQFPPTQHYLMQAKEGLHTFHPQLPASRIWGFNGTFPGPTVHARYGEPVLLRIVNDLPPPSGPQPFGVPEVITHLHNAHTAPGSDGGPWDWTQRGQYTDHHYLQARAGFTMPPGSIPDEFRDASGGDVRETLTTLFFHYHRPEVTTDGVYKGLVAFWLNFDERDTGNEEDSNPSAWRLPSGPYDIPLLITDKQFDPRTGELFFDMGDREGVLGDKITVNGGIQPFLEVKRRKYRFRMLNGGPARFYTFVLRKGGRSYPFTQLTHSGNFLERPRTNLTRLETQVAERNDIIIDFSQFRSGDKVYLANILPMKDGRQPERDPSKALNPDDVKNQLLEFRVTGDAADPSKIPDEFRPFPPITMSEVVRRRVWRFERGNGIWQINAEGFDHHADHMAGNLDNPKVQIRRNTAEIWTLENRSGGWEHPVHIHLEEARVIRVNGRDVTNNPAFRQRTDMYRLGRNGRVELFMRFRDFPDPAWYNKGRLGEHTRYVMHCHNMTHEDHSMMVTWNLVP